MQANIGFAVLCHSVDIKAIVVNYLVHHVGLLGCKVLYNGGFLAWYERYNANVALYLMMKESNVLFQLSYNPYTVSYVKCMANPITCMHVH
jgi:hypothetical protein